MPYYCPNCGTSNPDSAAACYNCGAPNPTVRPTDPTPPVATSPFEAPTQPQSPYQAPSYPPYPPPVTPSPYGMPPPAPYQQPYVTPDVTPAYGAPLYGQVGYQNPAFSVEAQYWQGRARTSLILGILGLLCCGLLGPVALALGMQAKNSLQRLGVMEGQTMALVGMILGGVATALWLLWTLVSLVSR
jgi:hypothetical protein